MRLTKIHVTKLFGVFDHTIPLNLDDRITIIHGPNGFGNSDVANGSKHFGKSLCKIAPCSI